MASISLPPFLNKLLTITQTCDRSIADWSPDGKQFVIKANERFEKEVLKKHFKGSKSTFIRQLHFYDFKKLDNKGSSWAFEHPKLQRGSPYLIYEIKRKTRTETAGPASKDEVQALREETVILRKQMGEMQRQVDFLQRQMQQLMAGHGGGGGGGGAAAGGWRQPNGGGNGGSDYHYALGPFAAFADTSNDLYHKKPKLASDAVSDDGSEMNNSLGGMLPFEDNSYRSRGGNEASSGDSDSIEDDGVPTKPSREFDDFDVSAVGDFGDLFFSDAMDIENTIEHHQQQQKQKQKQQQPQPIAAKVCMANASSSSSGQSITDLAEDCEVHLCSPRGQVRMENQIFAGFLAKFIEHSQLLHRKNMLRGDIDPELEVFVHASLPIGCPLKDMLLYSPSMVRTVLVNVLADVPPTAWGATGDDQGPDEVQGQESFMSHALLVFKYKGASKEINGGCFLHFLSFLLRAAVRGPSPSASSVGTEDSVKLISPFWFSFEKYFSREVNKVMRTAHLEIAAAKKNCSAPSN